MKRNLVKIIGITISTILILQNSQVLAVTQKEIQQKKEQAQQQTAENDSTINEAEKKKEEIANEKSENC